MKLIWSVRSLLRRASRPYLILRLLYYALIVWTMVYVTYDRSIQERFNQLILDTLGSGPLASVIDAYSTGQALLAVALLPAAAAASWAPHSIEM